MLGLAVALGCLTARAEEETVPGPSIIVLDGDGVALGSERLRLLDIDSPETFDARCQRELLLGMAARRRLAELLHAGPVVVDRRGKDRFGRTLGYLRIADGRDVGAILIAEGIALPYVPGPEESARRLAHWCGPLP